MTGNRWPTVTWPWCLTHRCWLGTHDETDRCRHVPLSEHLAGDWMLPRPPFPAALEAAAKDGS